MSAPSVNTANVELSPVSVTFNGVALGGTAGGVKISLKHEFADIMMDQLGKTPIDSVLTAQSYTVKLTLAETRSKDNWKVAFPNSKLINNAGTKSIYMDSQVGSHLLDSAHALVLHPLSKDDSDLSGDFKFFKAVAKSAVEVEYGNDKQVGLEVEFMIYPDSGVTPARFWVHGDPSNGLVAASVSSATAGGSNTGTGVVSSISAGASAVTETVTLTCVGIPASNKSNWEVSGGTSGVIGFVSISSGSAGASASFTSSKINFTIADGGTDFVIGDTFTIDVTGANYA